MATTDRVTLPGTRRTITDRLGEDVILGSAAEGATFDMDAALTVAAAGESEVFSAFSIIAAAVFSPVASYIEREYLIEALSLFTVTSESEALARFDMDAVASFAAITDQLEEFEMRNKVINGTFDFWQRGTSLAAATSTRYLADRWATSASVNHTVEPSRQAFTLGQTDVPGEPSYFHRAAVVTGAANAGNSALIKHRLEGVRTLAGQTCRVTFHAKADAVKNIATEFVQNFGTGGAPSASVTAIGVNTHGLTSSWQQFSVEVAISSISGKTIGTNANSYLELNFWLSGGSSFNARNGTLGEQAGTFDIANVQIEEGDIMTSFEQRPREIELSLCQRYYTKSFPINTTPASNAGLPGAISYRANLTGAGLRGSGISFSVAMRTVPTVVFYNPSAAGSAWRNVSGTTDSGTAGTQNVGPIGMWIDNNQVAGDTAGQILAIHWTADAEL